MKKIFLFFLFSLCISTALLRAQVTVTATAGSSGSSYSTVNDAFTAINAGTHQGAITITVSANTTEPTLPVPLLRSASPSAYSSITIKPQGNVVINSAATPTATRAMLELTGADNVTIDGDDPSTSGTQNLSLVMASSTSVTGVISLGSKSTTGADGDSNIVIRNCIITGGRANAAATASSYGIVFSNNATAATISSGSYSNKNVTIQNNLITRCYFGIYAAGASITYANINLLIRGNTLGSATSAENIGNRGIYVSYSYSATEGVSAIVENNDIRVGDYGTTGYSASIAGIEVATGNTGAIVRKNNVHDVAQPTVSGYGAFGISVTSATSNNGVAIINNFIRDITASNYSTTVTTSFINYGIYVSAAATGLIINHNTVALQTANLTGTTTNPVSACININSSTATVSQLLNNILVNTINSTNAYGIVTSGTINISGGTINNNNYYIPNGKVGYYNAIAATTLVNWQAATSKDGAALNVNPPFASSTDLHINSGTTPTQLESAGAGTATTGVSEDYDGQARPGPTGSVNGGAVAPDMGADEFDGVIQDIVAPAITYTNIGVSCSTGDRSFTATITDVSGVPTTGTLVPRVYYRKGTGGTWLSRPGTLSSGTATNGTWAFTISATSMGGLVANDSVYYYIIAQDVVATANIGSNPAGVVATNVNTVTTHPTTPNIFSVGNNLSGTYTVGAAGVYPTLTTAISRLNTGCLTGAVTLSLIDASYSSNETFPLTLGELVGSSTTNTVMIKPAAGASPVIAGSSSAIFKLNGTDNVMIDGANTVGGTTRNLTIQNTNATSGTTSIWVGSLGVGAGCNNVTIKNSTVKAGLKGSSTAASFAFFVGDVAGAAAGPDNDNLTIQNNLISNAAYGVQAVGATNGILDNLSITGNTFSTPGTDTIGYQGILASYASGATISGNTIRAVTNSANYAYGISVSTGVVNSTISGNNIYSVKYTGTGGYGGFGIDVNTGSATSNLTISNNMVANISGDGYSTFTAGGYAGIAIARTAATGGVRLYHNSVAMNQGTGYGGYSTSTIVELTAALYIGSTSTALDVRNNILYSNVQYTKTTSSTSKTYAIYSAAANTAFTTIDYNDYIVEGSQSVLAYIGSDRTDLTALQTGFGGNANSKNILPVFVDTINLHVSATNNAALDNLGTPVAGVTTDIDNQTRSTTTPDLGADEFGAPLPIKFEYLTGKKAGSTNALNWKVTCTSTSITMVLERSADARTFNTTVTSITATQARCGQPFDAVDATPINGISYYRLKMIDVDGKVSYSPVAAVLNGKAGAELVGIYPTVVKDQAYLSITSSRNTTMQLSISDMTGKVIKSINQAVSNGSSMLPVNTSSMASGVYNITGLLDGIRTQTLRFVKQ